MAPFLAMSTLLWTTPANAQTIRVAMAASQDALVIGSDGPWSLTYGGRTVLYRKAGYAEARRSAGGLRIADVFVPGAKIRMNCLSSYCKADGSVLNGSVDIVRDGGRVLAVGTLDLEDYLKGVVPQEVAAFWHPEVLKVQAVIARTYALFQARSPNNRSFDIEATHFDQVYAGILHPDPRVDRAVSATRGLVVTYKGRLARTLYHSTSAGPTEASQELWPYAIPYLQGVECPFDEGSLYYRWTVEVPGFEMAKRLAAAGYPVGEITSVLIEAMTRTGRVGHLRIVHSNGELVLRGEHFRRAMGYAELRSTKFRVFKSAGGFRFEGMGWGHGVGLCQWGAKTQAERGKTFQEILAYYYPGTEVVDIRRAPDLRPDL